MFWIFFKFFFLEKAEIVIILYLPAKRIRHERTIFPIIRSDFDLNMCCTCVRMVSPFSSYWSADNCIGSGLNIHEPFYLCPFHYNVLFRWVYARCEHKPKYRQIGRVLVLSMCMWNAERSDKYTFHLFFTNCDTFDSWANTKLFTF